MASLDFKDFKIDEGFSNNEKELRKHLEYVKDEISKIPDKYVYHIFYCSL